MKQIKKLITGEVYYVKKNSDAFQGILIEKVKHPGKEYNHLTFYTSYNSIEEFYEEEGTYFKDLSMNSDIISLLKEYYNEIIIEKKVSEEILKLQLQRSKIWDRQKEIASKIVEITGINKNMEIDDFYETADMKEDSSLKIAMDNVKDTVKTVKKTKQYKSIHQRLGNGFDKFWDFVDHRKYS